MRMRLVGERASIGRLANTKKALPNSVHTRKAALQAWGAQDRLWKMCTGIMHDEDRECEKTSYVFCTSVTSTCLGGSVKDVVRPNVNHSGCSCPLLVPAVHGCSCSWLLMAAPWPLLIVGLWAHGLSEQPCASVCFCFLPMCTSSDRASVP